MRDRFEKIASVVFKAYVGDDLPSAEEIEPSPIDGKKKQSAINYVYRIYGRHSGFYRDSGWDEINKIIKDLREKGGLNVETWTENGGYFQDENGHVAGKTWKFKIPFLNQNWKPDMLRGEITASLAGTVEQYENDYLGEDRPYDIIFNVN